jgi:superfamily I DNA/RNA helicase
VNYILVEKSACHDIVQNRFLQNSGFSPARELIGLLKGESGTLPGLTVTEKAAGYIITKENVSPTDDAVVFDLETLRLMDALTDSEALIAFQKTLRFCVKFWDGLALSSSELFIKGSSKAIIFPLPSYVSGNAFRVAIEREPNAKRLSKRTNGRYLLAYKSGRSEGNGAGEEASLTNFKKAYDDFANLTATLKSPGVVAQNQVALASLNVTTLQSATPARTAEQGFERWMRLLTDEQKAFVASEWSVPHRLEGPAGTGKTLCLVLKAIRVLNECTVKASIHRALFVVPSDELAASIKERFVANGFGDYVIESFGNYNDKSQSITVITLQKLCAQLLNYDISESEFLDRDSIESKNTQLLYLDEVVSSIKSKDLPILSQHLSPEFYNFLNSEDAWTTAHLLRHEVSVVIKGRANGQLDVYKTIPPLEYGLPTKTLQDKEYVYSKYVLYQESLERSNQYDIDDIVISAIGQLDTPIWRRRRQQLGFDSVFIDEVHHFNLNEISILHYLTKSPALVPISYGIDRTQAIGDIGWNDKEFQNALNGKESSGDSAKNSVSAIFRSSAQIIELAFCVTASGANLFTNFENPLVAATETFTAEEERKSGKPCITYIFDDQEIPLTAYKQADQMSRTLQVSKSEVLVVVFDEQLLNAITDSWKKLNKSFKLLNRRGDFGAVDEANKAGCLIISAPEFVGGLEFSGTVLVGCEKGRLPQNGSVSDFGKAYLNYQAHNNLYVSITRAKYRVEFIVNKNRGISDVLHRATEMQLLTDCSIAT